MAFHLQVVAERRKKFRFLVRGEAFDKRVVDFIAQNLGMETTIAQIIELARVDHGTWLPEIGKITRSIARQYGAEVPVGNANYQGKIISPLVFDLSTVLLCTNCGRVGSAECLAEGFLVDSPACAYHRTRR